MDHKNIVRMVNWSSLQNRSYMVLEICVGGDVWQRMAKVKRFGENAAVHVIKQAAAGLQHMHKLNIGMLYYNYSILINFFILGHFFFLRRKVQIAQKISKEFETKKY